MLYEFRWRIFSSKKILCLYIMDYKLSNVQDIYFENLKNANINLMSSLSLLDETLEKKELNNEKFIKINELIIQLLETNYYLNSIQNTYNDISNNIINIIQK